MCLTICDHKLLYRGTAQQHFLRQMEFFYSSVYNQVIISNMCHLKFWAWGFAKSSFHICLKVSLKYQLLRAQKMLLILFPHYSSPQSVPESQLPSVGQLNILKIPTNKPHFHLTPQNLWSTALWICCNFALRKSKGNKAILICAHR